MCKTIIPANAGASKPARWLLVGWAMHCTETHGKSGPAFAKRESSFHFCAPFSEIRAGIRDATDAVFMAEDEESVRIGIGEGMVLLVRPAPRFFHHHSTSSSQQAAGRRPADQPSQLPSRGPPVLPPPSINGQREHLPACLLVACAFHDKQLAEFFGKQIGVLEHDQDVLLSLHVSTSPYMHVLALKTERLHLLLLHMHGGRADDRGTGTGGGASQ